MTDGSACAVETCPRPACIRDLCDAHYTRWLKRGDTMPDKPLEPSWGRGRKPDERPTYAAAHKRIRKILGRASQHECYRCGNRAREWAYDHSDPNEQRGSVQGYAVAYSLDPDYYVPLCIDCHRALDQTGKSRGVRLLPSGRWQARITIDGKRRAAPTTFESRGEAEAWVREQCAEMYS